MEGIEDGVEEHISNWLPISSLPADIWFHKSAGFSRDGFKVETLPYPGEKHGEHLLSFVPPDELRPMISETGIQTYPGRETPLPLQVEISKGDADIETVAKDILALTKLNYNSCRHADGLPVTLRFADAVGEILVSGPPKVIPPLAFRFYI